MEKVNQQFNSSIENISQDVSAAETVIKELDQLFYSSAADRNASIHSYLSIACQLTELSKSYQEIQNLLSKNKNQDIKEIIN
jgi:hypothetical protein